MSEVGPPKLVVQALPSPPGRRYVTPVYARLTSGAFKAFRDERGVVPGPPFHVAFPEIRSSACGEQQRPIRCARNDSALDAEGVLEAPTVTRAPLHALLKTCSKRDLPLENAAVFLDRFVSRFVFSFGWHLRLKLCRAHR